MNPAAGSAGEISITFEGVRISARLGDTIAAALVAAGQFELRHTLGGETRGVFCGMGICHECLVEVDGRAGQRACMTKITGAHRIRRQPALPRVAANTERVKIEQPARCDPEILVVGAGPAGLRAAIAAADSGAAVTVMDERPEAGGQYFKQRTDPKGHGDRQMEAGRRLIETALAAGVKIVSGATVWGAFPGPELAAVTPQGSAFYRPRKLIVGAGAFERALPLPGWTSPGVMTTGAAQTLLRSYGVVPGKRILIAGNGPLNLQVALELKRAGAHLTTIFEAAKRPGVSAGSALARMAMNSPGLFCRGISYLAMAGLRGIDIHYGQILVGIEKASDGLVAVTSATDDLRGVRSRSEPVDTISLGYGFMPSNEILRALGSRHRFDPARGTLVTERDQDCATTVQDVYAVGDCCGLGGAPAAMDEGYIAGVAAARSLGHRPPDRVTAEVETSRRRLKRHRVFQEALWEVFLAPRMHAELCVADTLVCRCEDVTKSHIDDQLRSGSLSVGDLKRRTRAGMGRCQGRYCGPVLAELVAAFNTRPIDEMSFFAPRVPFKPVAIAEVGTTTRP